VEIENDGDSGDGDDENAISGARAPAGPLQVPDSSKEVCHATATESVRATGWRKAEEDDESGDGNDEEKRSANKTAINGLLRSGGRPAVDTSKKATRRRVTRVGGIAMKAGVAVEALIAEANDVHGLRSSPLTLRDLLLHTTEGRELLEEAVSATEDRIVAEAAKVIVKSAGRAAKAAVVGMLAAPNSQGQLSLQKVVEFSGSSRSHISNSRAKQTTVGPKAFSTYTDQNMVRKVKRNGISEVEKV
jgi:hypothetical protein